MKISREVSGRDGCQKKRSLFLAIVIDAFVVLLLTGQQLVYDDFYYNILQTKYHYFCVCTISMLVLFGLYGLFRLAVGLHRKQVKLWPPKEWLGGRKLRDVFNSTDVMLILFIAIALISTRLSFFFYEAFWGNEGRYTGMFTLLLLMGIYFCVSRWYRVRWWHLELFLIAGMMMCLFGISDYFNMDLLHFKAEISDQQKNIFVSFIGNINTYTACVALVMGMSGVLFASCKSLLGNIWYGICIVISFIAIITGQSDSAYLALMAFFGFLPLYLFKNRHGFRKYVVLLAIFFSCIQWVSWTQTAYEGTVIRLAGLFRILFGFAGIPKVVKCLWVLVALLYGLEMIIWAWKKWGSKPAGASAQKTGAAAKIQPESPSRTMGAAASAAKGMAGTSGATAASAAAGTAGTSAPAITETPETVAPVTASPEPAPARKHSWFTWFWWLVIAAAVALMAYGVYDATILGNGEKYGALRMYLEFKDSWGTSRGYIWRIAVEDYMKFSPIHKIFGYGPDTFGLLTWFNNMPEMYDLYKLRFDSVHNVYLQYLVTIGPFGLLAYLGIFATGMWNTIKRHMDNPYIMGALFAVACYNVQEIVNINQPIATPIMWLLFCISVSAPAKLPKWLWKRKD